MDVSSVLTIASSIKVIAVFHHNTVHNSTTNYGNAANVQTIQYCIKQAHTVPQQYPTANSTPLTIASNAHMGTTLTTTPAYSESIPTYNILYYLPLTI